MNLLLIFSAIIQAYDNQEVIQGMDKTYYDVSQPYRTVSIHAAINPLLTKTLK